MKKMLIFLILIITMPSQAQMYKRYNRDGGMVYTNFRGLDTQAIPPIERVKKKAQKPKEPTIIATSLAPAKTSASPRHNTVHKNTRRQLLLDELEAEKMALQSAQSASSELEERIAVLHADDVLIHNHRVLERERQQLAKSIATHQSNISLLSEELNGR